MHLYINMKQLGKRKNMVDKVAFFMRKRRRVCGS